MRQSRRLAQANTAEALLSFRKKFANSRSNRRRRRQPFPNVSRRFSRIQILQSRQSNAAMIASRTVQNLLRRPATRSAALASNRRNSLPTLRRVSKRFSRRLKKSARLPTVQMIRRLQSARRRKNRRLPCMKLPTPAELSPNLQTICRAKSHISSCKEGIGDRGFINRAASFFD